MIRTFNKKAILSRIERIEKAAPLKRLINAFLEQKDGKYHLDCRLWDGVNGSGTKSVISEHQTFQEALNEFEKVQQKYPSDKDVLLFVDDLQEELIYMDDDLYRDVLKDMSTEE